MGLDVVQLVLKISAEKILPFCELSQVLLLCTLLLGNTCVVSLHSALSTAPSCDGEPGLSLLKG